MLEEQKVKFLPKPHNTATSSLLSECKVVVTNVHVAVTIKCIL